MVVTGKTLRYILVAVNVFYRYLYAWPSQTKEPVEVKEASVFYTHLRAHETKANLVCRLVLGKKIS